MFNSRKGRGVSAPFTIIVDSREKDGYTFSKYPFVTKKLDIGDYSIEGLEEIVAVERKSLADFMNTITRGRARFHVELGKMKRLRAKCVVVESTLRDVLDEKYKSGLPASNVLGTVMSINIDFGIPVFFCSDRQAAIVFVEKYLEKCWKACG